VFGRDEERTDTAAMGSMPALRAILAYGASMGMRFRHLSVDMAVPLPEPVFATAPNKGIWKIHKTLRGLKGSSKTIDRAIRDCLYACDFKKTKERGVFVLPSPHGRPRAIVFQYGDELLVASWTAGLKALLPLIKSKFKDAGAVDDLGEPALFLGIGIEVFPHNCDVLLQQNHYIEHVLDGVPELEGWRPRTVPLTPETVQALTAAEPETERPIDRKWWRRLVGQLSWLARCTRPDIAFATAYLARFSSSTTLGEAHRAALLDVLSYLRTREYELKLGAEDDSPDPHTAHAYSHGAVPAGNTADKAHIGWSLLLDGSAVDWASHRSTTASTPLEADLVAQGEAAHRLAWLLTLLADLGIPTSPRGLLFGDNVGVVNHPALGHVLQTNAHVRAEYEFMLELEGRDGLSLHECDGEEQAAKLLSSPTDGRAFKRYGMMHGLERQLSAAQVEALQGRTEEEALQALLEDSDDEDLAEELARVQL
jgi:hypothetical protein